MAGMPWGDAKGCDSTKKREDTRQERSGVCHVRRGDDSSVRLKVCWLFKAGNRYVTKLRYSFAPGPSLVLVEEMSFLLERKVERG